MRKKTGLLVVALAILVVTAAPAARAEAVTFVDPEGALENEAEVFAESLDMEWETFNGPIDCEQFRFETTVLENSADPAVLQEAPATIKNCTAWSELASPKVENVKVGPITVASDGTGLMPIEYGYTVGFNWKCPKVSGTLELDFTSSPVEYGGWVYSYACPLGASQFVSGHLSFSSINGPMEVTLP